MRYPMMQEVPTVSSATQTFLGYHHAARIGAGESFDERNLSAEEYPILTQRRKRGTVATPESPQGLIDKDGLCWIDGTKFVMAGTEYDLGLSTAAKDNPKRLVGMGANVIILPDKKYINTKNPADCGSIEEHHTTAGAVTFTVCDSEGEALRDMVIAEKAPEDPANGLYWLDTGSKPSALNRWSEADAMWVQIATSYVKISGGGIENHFQEMDGINITGGEGEAGIKDLMGSHVVWRKAADGLIVIGLINGRVTTNAAITFSREMPELDFVIESGNRLWGCRYGKARNGEFVNEIYASKQGDFKNWNFFQGISTDSWVGSCGSDGAWTGAANYLGSPVFFKEGHIHRVYGSVPSQYAITDTVCQGVQAGSERSLVNLSNVLLYKGRTAVCAYDGSMPSEISDALGQQSFTEAVAGGIGYLYYISMVAENGEPVLFTYDLKKGIWHKEDGLRPLAFSSAGKELYCIDADNPRIVAVTGAGAPEEEPIDWEVITGEIGLEKNTTRYSTTVMPEEKYMTKLALRMQMEAGAVASVWLQYDGGTRWEKAATVRGSGRLRSFTIPIRPKRCDWLRMKIQGTGKTRIYSMVKWTEGGSDATDNNGTVLDV